MTNNIKCSSAARGFLTQAREELAKGDLRQASEKGWGAAAQMVKVVTRDPQDIIGEVDAGYYIAGHRTPSIAESRENFRITAVKVYEIKNGQLGKLYRDGGISADSRDYFLSIDAVGNDLRVNPIPNCGKGQPMQAKRMSNGGPTMRGIARLTGPG